LPYIDHMLGFRAVVSGAEAEDAGGLSVTTWCALP
jgi:hypothetical protein